MSAAPVDFTAPVPLGHFQAIEKAVQLRERGNMWTWTVLSDVMALYHGFHRSPEWWKRQLAGRVAPRARGVPFTSNDPRVGSRNVGSRNGRSPAERADAVRRYEAGESSGAIAQSIGCSKRSVIEWARAADVPIRPPRRYGP